MYKVGCRLCPSCGIHFYINKVLKLKIVVQTFLHDESKNFGNYNIPNRQSRWVYAPRFYKKKISLFLGCLNEGISSPLVALPRRSIIDEVCVY